MFPWLTVRVHRTKITVQLSVLEEQYFVICVKTIIVQFFKGVCNVPTVAMATVQYCKKTL